MTTEKPDTVERLRTLFHRIAAHRGALWDSDAPALLKAADEIERLREALREVMELVDGQMDVDDGMPNLAMQVHVLAGMGLKGSYYFTKGRA
jgi:hypothetical protein